MDRSWSRGSAAVFLAIMMVQPMLAPVLALGPESPLTEEAGTTSIHLMTAEEVDRLKAVLGVKDPSINYNQICYGYGTGYAPPTEEQYSAMVGQALVMGPPLTASPIAAASDLSSDPHFPVVGDQGNVGSCAAWALAYYCYGYLEAKDNNWTGASLGDPSQLISPSWCYNKVNGGKDTGTWMGEVGSVLTTWGAATLATMPYIGSGTSSSRYLDWGGEAAFREAPLHRTYSTVSLDLEQPWSTILDNMRSVVASGTPLTFAIDANALDPSLPGDKVITSAEYSYTGLNHAQTIVGYDDDKVVAGEAGAFKVVNSWGEDFWGSGYYWITYKGFQKILSSNSANQLAYVIDRADYSPTIVGVWHYDVPQKQDRQSSISVTTVGGSATLRPYYWASSYNFPYFLCLDLTDLQLDYDLGRQTFALSVASSNVGTVSSFRTELYAGGYVPGQPNWASPPSPDAPVSGSTVTALSTLPSYWPTTISSAADCGPCNLSTGGAAAWVPTGAEYVSGNISVQSGDVALSSSSWLSLMVEGDGIVEFDWRLDAAPYADTVTFSLDGMVSRSLNGTTAWAHVVLAVQGTSTELRWTFLRQGYGGGCAYIDNITWSSGDLRIDGDEELQSLAHLLEWSGTGSQEDPFLIEGYTVHQPSTEVGLYIGNTSLWIELKGCQFLDADQPGQAGLHLHNASNIVVTDGIMSGNERGMVMDNCSNIVLTAVTVTASAAAGIVMMDSEGVVISGCNISGNHEGLIVISSQVSVHDNLFYQNEGEAIRAIASPGSHYGANAFAGNNGTTAAYDPTRPQAHDVEEPWGGSWEGNYWSDLSGPDADGDGAIDEGRYVVGGREDGRPMASIVSGPIGLEAVRDGTKVLLEWHVPVRTSYVTISSYEIKRMGPEGMLVFTSLTTSLLDDLPKVWGEHTYEVRAITWLGIGPYCPPVGVTIPDLVPPSLVISSPRDGAWFNSLVVSVSWNCSDAQTGVDHYEVSKDGEPFSNVGLDTAASVSYLNAGPHQLTVRAYDGAGNTAEATATFTIDLVPPTISVLSPSAGSVLTRSTVTISVAIVDVGSADHRDTVKIDGKVVWSDKNVSPITLGADLEDGPHTLTITSTDRAGNSATSTTQFIVDTSPPEVVLDGLTEGEITPSQDVTVHWNCSTVAGIAALELSLDGGDWVDVAGSTSWTMASMAEGSHAIVVRVTDGEGRSDQAWLNFTVDTIGPTIDILEPLEGALLNTSTPTISWLTSDGTGVSHFLIKLDDGAWVQIGEGTFSYSLSSLADGEHRITIKAVDLAGNANETSATFSVDTEPITAWLDLTSSLPLDGPIIIKFSKPVNASTVDWAASFPASAEIGIDALTLYPTPRLSPGQMFNISLEAEGVNGLSSGQMELIFSTVDRGVVSGKVTDAEGKPVAGASVTSAGGVATETDADGLFSLELPYGPINLTIHKQGFDDLVWEVQVEAGETANVGSRQLAASPNLEVYLLPIAVVLMAIILLSFWRFKRSN